MFKLMYGEVSQDEKLGNLTQLVCDTKDQAVEEAFALFLELHDEERREVSRVRLWATAKSKEFPNQSEVDLSWATHFPKPRNGSK